MVFINNIPSSNFDEKGQFVQNYVDLGLIDDIARDGQKGWKQKRNKFGMLSLGGKGNEHHKAHPVAADAASGVAVQAPKTSTTFKPPLAANTKSVYTEEDLLANTLYIFLILSFVTIVIAGISFAVREKVSSYREEAKEKAKVKANEIPHEQSKEEEKESTIVERPKESPKPVVFSNDSKPIDVPARITPEMTLQPQLESFKSPFQSSQLTGLGFLQEAGPPRNLENGGLMMQANISPGFSNSGNKNYKFSADSSDIDDEDDDVIDSDDQWSNSANSKDTFRFTDEESESAEIKKIEIFQDEINSPGFSEGSITNFLNEQFKDIREINKGGKKKSTAMYSFKQLYTIGSTIQKSSLFGGSVPREKGLKLSHILTYSYDIPKKVFKTTWTAEKTISEARLVLLSPKSDADHATKTIALFILLSTASSKTLLDNPNHFLSAFNDFIDHFVDTGAIYNVLEHSNLFTQSLIIDMIVTYCWSQWNFKSKRLHALNRSFKRWKIEPVVQNRNTIFRFICNLELGMSSVANMEQSSRLENEFKIHTLLRECIRLSHCNDYIGFIPMLAQAVDISRKQNIKYLFYEVLFVLVQKHSSCCMSDYLGDTKTDLKALVQHGLWHKHDHKINLKAKDIYNFLVVKNEKIEQWWNEVHGGRIFVSSSALPASSIHPSSISDGSSTQRPVTPGSWRFVSPVKQS